MANRQEKTKEQRIRAEKTRLRRIYKLLPKEAAGTVAGLIDQAAFMRIECEDMADDLRENGWIADGETVVLFNTGSGHKYSHLWK